MPSTSVHRLIHRGISKQYIFVESVCVQFHHCNVNLPSTFNRYCTLQIVCCYQTIFFQLVCQTRSFDHWNFSVSKHFTRDHFESISCLCTKWRVISNTVLVSEFAICFSLLASSYFLIFMKLYIQKRKIGTINRNRCTVQLQDTMEMKNDSKQKQSEKRQNVPKPTSRAVHIKTIQMFGVITLIFVWSFIPSICILLRITRQFHILYAIFINHITNFGVYMVFNSDFRKDIFDLCRKMKKQCDLCRKMKKQCMSAV